MKLDPRAIYDLLLASCPNRDFGEVGVPKPPMIATGTLEEIYRDAAEYRRGLGGGNWARANLFLRKKLVGRMAYNGRVFSPGRWTPEQVPLCEPPEWYNQPR